MNRLPDRTLAKIFEAAAQFNSVWQTLEAHGFRRHVTFFEQVESLRPSGDGLRPAREFFLEVVKERLSTQHISYTIDRRSELPLSYRSAYLDLLKSQLPPNFGIEHSVNESDLALLDPGLIRLNGSKTVKRWEYAQRRGYQGVAEFRALLEQWDLDERLLRDPRVAFKTVTDRVLSGSPLTIDLGVRSDDALVLSALIDDAGSKLALAFGPMIGRTGTRRAREHGILCFIHVGGPDMKEVRAGFSMAYPFSLFPEDLLPGDGYGRPAPVDDPVAGSIVTIAAMIISMSRFVELIRGAY